MILDYKGISPKIGKNCFIAENASVIGDVTLGDNVTILFSAVVRGDSCPIVIGSNSNVQDNATVHGDAGTFVNIGEYVTIGHNAVVHGCTIKDNALIGMGATVLNNAIIEEHVVVGAGALCREKMSTEAGDVLVGVPAKIIKNNLEGNKASNRINAEHYVEMGTEYGK